MQKIESVSNEKIKLAVKVALSSKARKQTGLFFLEGLRLCRDAALSGYEIESTFVSSAALLRYGEDVKFICEKSGNCFEVSAQVEKKLTQAQTPQGIFCLCKMKENSFAFDFDGKYIALENIQDPANLGAVCRTAEALGIKGAVIYSCCDLYNPKTQRAAMGSALRLPVFETQNLAELLTKLKGEGMKLYATTPDSSALKITKADMSGGVVAVIGNEGNGVSDGIFALCQKLTIPMLGRAESLNASMAAAITMWEMMRSES
ncbi:MAG: TrmH family RNA methyltransferase [Acutalibacteraceae bacterium]